ncbi:YdcF family protein [Secundilactobacillus folii]|uniref:YdcF family protein n=1 Tax=Secundilactobacillus folii TaxID=2678357 RepID=UPI001FED20E9|nr:YdcF family protein [Secundilactobacillus folii]
MQGDYGTYIKFGWLLTCLFLICFGLSYWRNRTWLRNGIWFSLFFYTFWLTVAITIIGTGNNAIIYPVGFLFLFLLFCLALVFVLQAILLLWNARIVWKRESHSLANSLTLLLGIVLILLPFISHLINNYLPPFWSDLMITFPALCILYAIFWFYNYLTVLVLYQFYWPRLNQDFIIVLGAGLMNGNQVTPLLRQRIDRGIRFYRQQLKKTGHAPKMIFSGGQGGDETAAEGEVMRQYAIHHGVAVNDALAETASKTTYENMVYSKKIIDNAGITNPKTIFVTNNYHTFRAAMFAKAAGLKANGIGSHTAGFFLPNAVMREYIAIVLRQRKLHLIMVALMLLFSIFWVIMTLHSDWVAAWIQALQQFFDNL